MTEITQDDCKQALDRIARSPDGQIFYRFLQRTLCAVCLDPDLGALRGHEGRRMFAAELMAIMAEGIADSDRYAITFVRASRDPSAQPRARGAGRRVTDDTFVPGWDTAANVDSLGAGSNPSPDGSGPAGGNAA